MTHATQRQGLVLPLQDRHPIVPDSCLVAPGAMVLGDVQMGEDCSIWYHTVLRGDVGKIRLGDRVNVQDQSMIHMSTGVSDAIIGNDVTIGHRATIHGGIIEDFVLIGMGATILDNAVIGTESLVGAGALVTGGKVFPPRSLILGSPAKFVKELSDEEVEELRKSAKHYVKIAQLHRQALQGNMP